MTVFESGHYRYVLCVLTVSVIYVLLCSSLAPLGPSVCIGKSVISKCRLLMIVLIASVASVGCSGGITVGGRTTGVMRAK